ncbi:MAG: S41 family peptidase, partial [Candidatus Paceibacterota bacterium]
ASAAEVVAGVLSARGVSLVGEKTYGKGSIQVAIDIGIGRVSLTVAYYLTASGQNIDKFGIFPDVEVRTKISDIGTNGDEVLLRAIDIVTLK